MYSDDKSELTNSELLDSAVEQSIMVARTIMIGECVSFDEAKNTVSVQPVLKTRKRGWTDARAMPVIQDVPVAFYGAGGVVVTYKPVAGDCCELRVCDRAIDLWKKRGGIVDPQKPRHHNISDAIAYFGLNPYPSAYKSLRGGLDMRTRDGSTSLNVTGGEIVATVGGTKVAKFGGSSVQFLVPVEMPKLTTPSAIIGGKEMNNHTHPYTDDGNQMTTGANNG